MVLYFALALAVLIGIASLSALGFELLPPELAANVNFIKLKPTLAYAAFALFLLCGEFGLHINAVRLIAGGRLNLPPPSWRQYLVGLAVLLVVLAVLNAVVAATVSVETWLSYRLFGALGLLLLGIYVLALRLLKLGRRGL